LEESDWFFLLLLASLCVEGNSIASSDFKMRRNQKLTGNNIDVSIRKSKDVGGGLREARKSIREESEQKMCVQEIRQIGKKYVHNIIIIRNSSSQASSIMTEEIN
jgi:hypothetical protein